MINPNDKSLFESKCKEMLRLWEQDPCRINNQKVKAMQELMSKPRIADEMKPGWKYEILLKTLTPATSRNHR